MSDNENDKIEKDTVSLKTEDDTELEFPKTKFVYIKKSISPEELKKLMLREREK